MQKLTTVLPCTPKPYDVGSSFQSSVLQSSPCWSVYESTTLQSWSKSCSLHGGQASLSVLVNTSKCSTINCPLVHQQIIFIWNYSISTNCTFSYFQDLHSLWCDTMLLSTQFPMLWRTIMPSSLGPSNQRKPFAVTFFLLMYSLTDCHSIIRWLDMPV